jgi:catechol 2,3-dioxygenase
MTRIFPRPTFLTDAERNSAMTINAALRRLVISSPNLERMASFYADGLDCCTTLTPEECRCEGDARSVWFRRGAANQLLQAHFAFPDATSVENYALALAAREVPYRREPLGEISALVATDPDGGELWFGIDTGRNPPGSVSSQTTPARVQHYAIRTPTPQVLVDFYTNSMGFTTSDLVRDTAENLTAAFLRTDAEHHVLAIFRAPERRLDHISFETRDWYAIREWADHLARHSIKLVWGIGRHGPGNDTFFMVHDPDGNLVEISSDLEICVEDRPVGIWEHRMETLNQWGIAIMRS